VADSDDASKKVVAGVLGILLGWTGAHRFYLGDTQGGIIRLVLSLCTLGAGGLIGFIEGIIYITKSDSDFKRIYIDEKKAWF
jgi:TM2 domain-containing membrane protein YozV